MSRSILQKKQFEVYRSHLIFQDYPVGKLKSGLLILTSYFFMPNDLFLSRKLMCLSVYREKVESQFCYLIAVWFLANHLTFLSLYFLICKRKECQLSGFMISNFESVGSGLINFTTLYTQTLYTDIDSLSGNVHKGLSTQATSSGWWLRGLDN